MKNIALLILFSILISSSLFSQNPPWKSPLRMAWSTNGTTFTNTSIFQDSSGVPCVIRWKGDTLIATFQWFRQPNPSPSWDRVAVKFSYDNGLNWTEPTPININGFPINYQRPFDPSLTVFGKDSIRIYYSSSKGMPQGGLDSTINTYSAISDDGINYTFEPNPRVDVAKKQVIDPTVTYFNSAWHYIAPVGAPQDGAYHYSSTNGVDFSPLQNITSDNTHNWTGNLMLENSSELRFYGSGPYIWYNSTTNGITWNGYVNTNIQGGDPSVLKLSNNNYLMIYVGQPYTSSINDKEESINNVFVYPNPATDQLYIHLNKQVNEVTYCITDISGKTCLSGTINNALIGINIKTLESGLYVLKIENQFFKIIKH